MSNYRKNNNVTKHSSSEEMEELPNVLRFQWNRDVSIDESQFINLYPKGHMVTDSNNGFCYMYFQDEKIVESEVNKKIVTINGTKVALMTARSKKGDYISHQVQKIIKLVSAPEIKDSSVRITDTTNKFPGTMKLEQEYKFQVIIKNNGYEQIQLTSVAVLPPQGLNLKIPSRLDRNPVVLGERQSFPIDGTFCPKSYGFHSFHVHIRLNDFRIVHSIDIHVKNEADLKLIGNITESRWVEPVVDDFVRRIIPAFPPTRSTKSHFHTPVNTQYLEKLPLYPIPAHVQGEIDRNEAHKDFNAWKTKDNYIQRMQNLLWIEEAQETKNIRRFDLKEVQLSDRDESDNQLGSLYPEYLYLSVPGLAEKRPSVLVKDSVYAWIPGSKDVEYEGVVQRTYRDKVALVFCEGFKDLIFPDRSIKFNIRFGFSRIPKRIMHRALLHSDIDIIWPEKRNLPSNNPKWKTKNDIDWHDRELSRNEEQCQAILSVVNKTNENIPFLLFGAFGCGKSRTILEMVIQILKNDDKAKVLICTQSNSAADYFARGLIPSFNPKEMHRLYAFQYSANRVDSDIIPYTQYERDLEVFNIPDLQRLKQFKIIISTCSSAASVYSVGVGANHFTHILLDEASQMMEPEALIPLSMASQKTTIVMAGDDKQIGPILFSSSAIHHKMGESIMWRISQLLAYEGCNDIKTCVKLRNNYRSHAAILNFLSNEFYQGHSLIQKGPKNVVESLHDWKRLPKKGFPVMFQSVQGIDLQAVDDPSFLNLEEASTIRDLVKSLMNEKSLQATDIGIISPYYKQVKTIRQLIASSGLPNWKDIKVGSPEEFQGSERKAIFISCVRSNRSYLGFDQTFSLGILKNEKRMNSAFSRAGCLLVVVGNPYILATDEHWRSFLEYCRDNESYLGPEANKVQETIKGQKQKEEDDNKREIMIKKTKGTRGSRKGKKRSS
eukprot:TRINITY_DN4618_c0_g3_i4.p1 TRINITY_DN4618_c0_g3~~TRINITY_DN4618_c0_g3_i4.p1  ORF type:complete len:945 (+),score=254.96 TRINITY_DN4618_c0_g3_i4:86-2920(+)